MKKGFLLLVLACQSLLAQTPTEDENAIRTLLNQWHRAAAEAKFDAYFSALTTDAIYIGTDATEHWTVPAFKAFAKPYFDKGKAWDFTALERHVYFAADGTTAWFDELLDTHMKLCRGSGVLVKVSGQWYIKHYVLSMTVPNDTTTAVVALKAPLENPLIAALKKD